MTTLFDLPPVTPVSKPSKPEPRFKLWRSRTQFKSYPDYPSAVKAFYHRDVRDGFRGKFDRKPHITDNLFEEN